MGTSMGSRCLIVVSEYWQRVPFGINWKHKKVKGKKRNKKCQSLSKGPDPTSKVGIQQRDLPVISTNFFRQKLARRRR